MSDKNGLAKFGCFALGGVLGVIVGGAGMLVLMLLTVRPSETRTLSGPVGPKPQGPPVRIPESRAVRVPIPGTPVRFFRVVDGDTIKVEYKGQEVSVRLLRINTPERGQPGYREATEELRKLIPGFGPVNLEFEKGKEERDRYGRLLAYVWFGGRNLNVEMVKRGHSKFWTKYGKGKYAAEFETAEKEAKGRASAAAAFLWRDLSAADRLVTCGE
jgi:endonuclease YncB( thermonuclease family)